MTLVIPAGAAAQEPAPQPLAVGSIRDQSGRTVPANVTVFAADGRVAGRGATAADGTFAILLGAAGRRVSVTCRHCAPLSAPLPADGAPVALIVTRYTALDANGLTHDDLTVLPYRDPAQAAALIPYAVAVSSGDRIEALSDRGLSQGLGLVLDDGVPVYDPVSGDQGLFAFPGRSVDSIQTLPPSRAFAYGSYAGGGTFDLQTSGDPFTSQAAFDSGGGFAASASAPSGWFAPSGAISLDPDGVLRERGDLAASGDVLGGVLRVQAALASQDSNALAIADQRSLSLLSLSYVTASRRYVTSFGADGYAERGDFDLSGSPSSYASQSDALDAYVRVEHPAFVTLAAGAVWRGSSANFTTYEALSSAHYNSELAYVEAKHDGPIWFDAGLSADRVAATADAVPGSETVALPSLSAGADVSDGLGLRLGASTSLRAPTLFELPVPVTSPAFEVERDALYEAAVDFDDARRFRVSADLFRQNSTGLQPDSLTGVGFSLVWQIAPRLSLRAWTLRDSTAANEPLENYGPYANLDQSFGRAALWSTYEAPGGLRFDAIARREAGPSGVTTDLDADAIAPLPAGFALALGTARTQNLRRAYLGLRWPHP